MSPDEPSSLRSWAEIEIAALRHNLGVAKSTLAPKVQIMAVVKADAYGHGLRAALAAFDGAVEYFGVANLQEARHLRREAARLRPEAPPTPTFLLGPALPGERAAIVAEGFVSCISTLEEAHAYSSLGEARGRPVKAHLAIDTGMGRMGVWQAEAAALAAEIARLPGLHIGGLSSHLPVADEDEAWTQQQLARFYTLAGELRARHFPGALLHIQNSAGILGFPTQAGDLVRPGLMLYGCSPLPEMQARLRPVLTWKTSISLVREVGPERDISYGRTYTTAQPMRLATLAVGYADGFRRHLSNRGADVLIGGRRCPVLGRVTMDQIICDVTAVPEAREGAEVVLLGRQGGEEILVAEMATRAGTIPWEIFTGLGARVARL